MSGGVVIGTWAGRIWHRTGAGSWSLAYENTGAFSHFVQALGAHLVSNAGMIGWLDLGAPDQTVVASSDNGSSWAEIGTIPATSSEQIVFGQSDDGNLYLGANAGIYRSPTGATWTSIIGRGNLYSPAVSNGYLWFYDASDDYLHRADLDGSNDTALTALGTIGGISNPKLVSTPCSNRIYFFSWTGTIFRSLDVTDPDNPSLVSGTIPNSIRWATPVSNLVGIALSYDAGIPNGTIYKTVDGGVNWSSKASDFRLAGQLASSVIGFFGDDVYVAGNADDGSVGTYGTTYCAVSSDLGETWTIETVVAGDGIHRDPFESLGVSGRPSCLGPTGHASARRWNYVWNIS